MKKLICSLVISAFAFTSQAQICNAYFTYTDSGSVYYFFDQSTADSNETVISWDWNFGDTATSTLQNPVHSYNNGYYTPCLQITTSDSCIIQYCDTVSIGCYASFGYTTNGLVVNFYEVSFNGTAWLYDFGDSATSTSQNPIHTYSSFGTYLVCLTIYNIDSIGDTLCTANRCINVTISCPTANFTYTTSPFNASFTDITSGTIVGWAWDFGDSSTSTLQNPSHTYANSGSYKVKLTVTHTTGCTSSTNKWINIGCGVDALFAYTRSGFTFSFADSSIGNAVSWFWDFDDGTQSFVQNPVHTFSTAGWHRVYLRAENASGCQDWYWTNVLIPCCKADFGFTVHDATVFFDNQSCTNPLYSHWDFGDGNSSTNSNPQHTYFSSGTYTVCMIGEYQDSGTSTCNDTICKNITVYQGDTCAELAIHLGTWGFRSCLNNYYHIWYRNAGNTLAANVQVKVELDPDLSALSSNPSWYTKTGNTITWNIDTIHPGQWGTIRILDSVSCNAAVGDILCSKSWIYPIVSDCYVNNNDDKDCHRVINSYDPNDKMVASRDFKTKGYVDNEDILATDTLTYQIRFQNTGTAEAINIVIEDDLDANLSLSSVVPGVSSHLYTKFEVTNGQLKWTFNGINLPDSNTNEPESHGFVKFRVTQQPNNPAGTVILNSADILFDFNAPVLTNTVVNTVKANLDMVEHLKPSIYRVAIYPNPFNNATTLYLQRDDNSKPIELTFTLYNILGKEVKRIEGISADQFQVQRGNLRNGIYIYKIRQDEEVIDIGKVVVKK